LSTPHREGLPTPLRLDDRIAEQAQAELALRELEEDGEDDAQR